MCEGGGSEGLAHCQPDWLHDGSVAATGGSIVLNGEAIVLDGGNTVG